MRPELFGKLEGTLNSVTQTTDYYRFGIPADGTWLDRDFPEQYRHVSANALAAPSGSPAGHVNALLTTSAGGVAPIFVGHLGRGGHDPRPVFATRSRAGCGSRRWRRWT